VGERIELGRIDAVALVLAGVVAGGVALSAAWSETPSQSIEEAERALIYFALLLAVFVLVPKRRVPELLAGVVAAATAVAAYGLWTRLFPGDRLTLDPVEGTLLIEPLGYANALGIVAAIGVLPAIAFAGHARARLGRALAASATVVLLPTLYLTQSRGAWLALGAGAAVALLVETRRLRFLAGAVALIPAAVAVWVASRLPDLRDPAATVDDVARAGHRLALAIVLLALASAGLVLAASRFGAMPARVRPSRLVTGVIVAALVALPVLAALQLRGHLGDRPSYWRAAWSEFESHPVVGSGAGTFASVWDHAHPRGPGVLDAHSLYLETIGELGVIGLLVLASFLVLPLLGAVRARPSRLVPGATGAYAAYLVHTGLDWDWEMPAATMAGLLCGAAVLVAARDGEPPRPISGRLRVVLLVVAGVVAALGIAVQVDHGGLASGAVLHYGPR
jgi:O-antigen ligase